MLQKKDDMARTPFALSFVRFMHVLLVLHATGIIVITYANSEFAAERLFAVMVAAPMLLGSFFSWFAATARKLFGTAVFFCIFLALLFAALPMMMNIFFPVHLVLFSLSAFYGISAILLVRCSFLQPIFRKK